MAWLNKYPDSGKVSSKVGDPPTKKVKINPLLDFRNDPFRPKGLGVQAQDNLRPLPIMDKVKADKEIQNRIALDKIKSQPQLNPTREQSIPQQKINLAKKQAYANSQPNAKLVNGQLEEINPGYTMEGQPFGPNEKRFDKGLNHIATGLEVAGYLTGAGELYRGLRGIKTAANAVEDVFWNGKSYQKTPLSNPTIVSQSQGIDALPAGYNANLGNQSPYVAATTDEALMTTQGRVDWNGVNSDNISNWFNTRANKSEIDWAKWNSEIPTNKALMSEYNTIEQTSKAKGTWMKNPDGSAFQGSPEQFVQQNSSNFKKAFPEGSENVFRGTGENIAELRPNRSTFTANQELASGYAPFNKKSNFLNSESVEGGVHSFYRKNSKNSLELDANNTSWTSVDLSNRRLTKDYFERNIKSQEDQITKQKEYLSKMKQNPNGSWEAPDGTTYSNDLYKNTVAERELYLKDLKERYKNIDNLVSNPKELEEMRKVLGDKTTTDDIAAYIEKKNLDYVKLKNIEDSGVGDVTIVNHKPGNYLKSAIGNNGMFNMTNPNIYKALVPAVAGVGVLKQKKNGGTIKNWLNKY